MADIVVNGNTSGAVTLSAPAVAGTVTVTLPSTTGTMLTTASSTGVSGSAISSGTVAEAYGGTGTSTGYYGFKNRIINGAMVIDQRNAGAAGSASITTAPYGVDRWWVFGQLASKFTYQQNAGAVTPPTGFTNYFGMTSSSAYAVVAGDRYVVAQSIEGFNTYDLDFGKATAKTITISFLVYSSLTGTFGGSLQNYAGTRSYPFTYSISVANTWEQKTVTIAGDTSGTWVGASNAGSMTLFFSLGSGSTYSGTAGAWATANYTSATGATSVVGTNGATFYITGVQLEKGSTATSFDYRPYGTELQLCQRYYAKQLSIATFTNFGIGTSISATNASMWLKFNVTMRSAPTIAVSGMGLSDGTNLFVITSLSTGYIGTDSALLQPVVSSGLVQFRPVQLQANNNASAFVEYSSEL